MSSASNFGAAWSRAALLFFFAALTLPFGRGSLAQVPTGPASVVTLKGIVTDGSGAPLFAADVSVDSLHHDISDRNGEFSIPGLGPGLLTLTVRRVGYAPVTAVIQTDPGLTVHLAVTLVQNAVQLSTVIIEGKRLYLSLNRNGFYRREELGLGHYFNPDYLAGRDVEVGRLVGSVPSILLQRNSVGAVMAFTRDVSGPCPLSVFIDGVYSPWVSAVGLDEAVNRQDLLAVEVYPHSIGVPAQYLVTLSKPDCGAVLLWTRRTASESVPPKR